MYLGVLSSQQVLPSSGDPISIIGSQTHVSTSSTSRTINFNESLAEGDMVLVLFADWGLGTLPNAISGYTSVYDDTGGNNRSRCAYKFMGPTPDTSLTIVSSSNSLTLTSLLFIRGAALSATIEASSLTAESPVGATFTVPSLVSASPGSLIVDLIVTGNQTNASQLTENTSLMNSGVVATRGASCANNERSTALFWKADIAAGAFSERTYNYPCADAFGTRRNSIIINPL